MSTATKRKLSATEAAKQAAYVLGLDDPKLVGIALAEAGAEQVASDREFAQKVKTLYAALQATAAQPKTTTSARGRESTHVELIPRKIIEGQSFDPAAPLDPYFLVEFFGVDQLQAALEREPVFRLKEAAVLVERRNPGTKPANRGQKKPLIDYMLQYVTG